MTRTRIAAWAVVMCSLSCSSDPPARRPGGDVTVAPGDVTSGDVLGGDVPVAGDGRNGDGSSGDQATGDIAAGDATQGDGNVGDSALGDRFVGDRFQVPSPCDPLTEIESSGAMGLNDTPGSATPVGFGTTTGELQSGSDVDYFSLSLGAAGRRFRVTATANGPVDLHLEITGPNTSSRFGSDPTSPSVQREVFIPAAGTYRVAVRDQRAFDGVPPVVTPGTFCYSLELTLLAPPSPTDLALPTTPTPVTTVHAVTQTGTLGFYRLSAPSGRFLEAVVISASAQAATQDGAQPTRLPDVDPIISVWDPTRQTVSFENDNVVEPDVMGGVIGNTNANLVAALAAPSSSREWWVIVDHRTLRNDDAVEAGPPGGLQTDVTLTLSLPTDVVFMSPFVDSSRSLTGDVAVQWYLVTEWAGSELSASADGMAGALSDVVLSGHDIWGAVLGTVSGSSTGMVQVAPYSDRTLIRVSSGDDLLGSTPPAGDYTLTIADPVGCSAVPSTSPPMVGDLVINEVLWDPLQDANADGILNAQQDEFVEILNVSSSTLDLSGVSVADAFGSTIGIRFVFPCGTTLPAGKATVIFAGGNPTGSFGGSLVSLANVTTPCAPTQIYDARLLCLSNSTSEGVVVRAANFADPTLGTELINLVFSFTPVANPEVSFNRCAFAMPPDAAACDMGSTYVRHDMIPGVTPFQSPGTRVDGSSFP